LVSYRQLGLVITTNSDVDADPDADFVNLPWTFTPTLFNKQRHQLRSSRSSSKRRRRWLSNSSGINFTFIERRTATDIFGQASLLPAQLLNNYRARLRAVRSLVASSAHSILIARPSIWIELIHLGAIALVNRVLTSAVTFIGGARRQALALVRTSVDTQINGPVWLSQVDLR
jgi:hypothetical protein